MMFKKSIESPVHFIHKNLLWFLLGLYVLALIAPQPGLWLRGLSFGRIVWMDGSDLKLSMPVFMLSFLLFNAGLGTHAKELWNLKKRPGLLIIGILANLLIPVAYIALFAVLGSTWHNTDELQHILVGLALVAAMPIAGSSTAWSQNVNGNLALSLGLVVTSTLLSPWTTPVVLHAVAFLTKGDYSEDLHELAQHGTTAFLAFSVVLPSLLGIIVRHFVGQERLRPVQPYLKLLNILNLLLLSYSNAAVSLPQAFIKPDWDFIGLVILLTSGLCLLAFGVGWLIAKANKATQAEQSALMFGLGMNNNGTGLVLSAMALGDHPAVMIPILFYNLSQQVIAGLIDAKVTRDNQYL